MAVQNIARRCICGTRSSRRGKGVHNGVEGSPCTKRCTQGHSTPDVFLHGHSRGAEPFMRHTQDQNTPKESGQRRLPKQTGKWRRQGGRAAALETRCESGNNDLPTRFDERDTITHRPEKWLRVRTGGGAGNFFLGGRGDCNTGVRGSSCPGIPEPLYEPLPVGSPSKWVN